MLFNSCVNKEGYSNACTSTQLTAFPRWRKPMLPFYAV